MIYLIISLIIAIGLFILLIILFHRELFKSINDVCETFRRFISENAGFFKIAFMLLFFLEQIIFIYVLNKRYSISKDVGAFIGAFALVVITTASFQAFVWEHKYYHTKQQLQAIKYVNLITERYEDFVSRLKDIFKIKSKKE